MKKLISVSVASGIIFSILWILRLFEVTSDPVLLSAVGAILFLAGAIGLKLMSPRIRPVRFFSAKSMGFLDWQISICVALLLICGSFLLNYLTGNFYNLLGVDVPAAYSGANYPSVSVAILCIAVLPALFEELFFRGAVLTMLRTSGLKIWAVIGVSSVLFMLLHGPGWYFITDLYAGILLALLVFFTGSVYSSILAHFIANFSSYFLALYGGKLFDAGIGNLTVHLVVVCFLGSVCHLLHLIKKLILRNEQEDRSRINENSRRWEEKNKGENKHGTKRKKVE